MRRSFHTVLALSFLALAGCTGQSEDAVEVVIVGDQRPALTDPAGGPLTVGQQVFNGAVGQGLVRFDARGQIEAGLAERWNVSDDGLSYIFRLSSGKWPNERTIVARDVARILKRELAARRNALSDTLGAIQDVVAMTDRVIEIRLAAPRPNLLQLLAQPEMAVIRDGQGTGPFQPEAEKEADGAIALTYRQRVVDGPDLRDHVHLRNAPAAQAIKLFIDGKAELVLGGTIDDLPLALAAKPPRRTLRFDPVAGLFGLVPARARGIAADAEARALLNRAIDRRALVDRLQVPGLLPRATLLQDGLDDVAAPVPPQWDGVPLAERRGSLLAEARRQFGGLAQDPVRLALPEGAGGTILYQRLAADWGALGLTVERVGPNDSADFRLVDVVAPSSSPAWFVRRFRCEATAVCVEDADALMDSARLVTVPAQRAALLAEAARLIEGDTLFLPLTAPIRWSLVSTDLPGFSENIVARHPLLRLREKLPREGQ